MAIGYAHVLNRLALRFARSGFDPPHMRNAGLLLCYDTVTGCCLSLLCCRDLLQISAVNRLVS